MFKGINLYFAKLHIKRLRSELSKVVKTHVYGISRMDIDSIHACTDKEEKIKSEIRRIELKYGMLAYYVKFESPSKRHPKYNQHAGLDYSVEVTGYLKTGEEVTVMYCNKTNRWVEATDKTPDVEVDIIGWNYKS